MPVFRAKYEIWRDFQSGMSSFFLFFFNSLNVNWHYFVLRGYGRVRMRKEERERQKENEKERGGRREE